MDLHSGRIYRINDSARSIIELGEKGLRVADVVEELKPDIKKTATLSFLKELNNMHLVEFFPNLKPKSSMEKPKPKLNFLWIELTSSCNLHCIHCYAGSKKGAETEPSSSLSTQEVKRVMDEAAALGCHVLQLTGGEPTLRSDLMELIDHAKAKGFEIEVFTNGNLLNEPMIRFFAERGVSVAMTIFSHRAETHDAITRVKGSFQKSLDSLKLLLAYGVPLRAAVVAMRQNEEELDETSYFLARLGVMMRPPDPIRPTGRGRGLENWPRKYGEQSMQTRPSFFANREGYERNRWWNSCWFGKAAVASNGDVLPCVFARDQVAGNIRKNSLEKIIRSKAMLSLWGLTKDQIEVCRDCEYRYACEDCRPWAHGFTDNLYSKSPRCTYDPYAGVWADVKGAKVPGGTCVGKECQRT